MDPHVSRALEIPAAELGWRFSRSSGPGGQHVNKTDSRVELSWDVMASHALTDAQRERLVERLGHKLINGVITVTASDQRSQLRNREIALEKLTQILAAALAADPPKRRPTKPTRGSARRHLATKTQRSATKKLRQCPSAD